MEYNRRSYGQNGSDRRSYNKKQKPPRGSTWKPTVPAWEKTFCKAIGSLDWDTFLDMKKYVDMYDNIIKWNDSAGEEAFCSAKNRFWAELNGIPCNVDIPDPDLYIDDIDWECQIDEGLLLDLDSRSVADSNGKSDTVIIFGDALIPNLPYSGTGWGTGWGDEEDIPKDQGNQWECSYEKSTGKENGIGAEGWVNDTWNLDKGDGWKSDWDTSQTMNREADFNRPQNRNYGSDGLWRKQDNVEATRTRTGMSWGKAPGFHGEGHNSNSSWKNCKGRNLEKHEWGENNTHKRRPKGDWNSNACRPNTHQASDNTRQTWNWKNSIS